MYYMMIISVSNKVLGFFLFPINQNFGGDVPTALPNNDAGWGGVDLSTTIVTPSSPQGLALKVYGRWSKGCEACPVVYDGESWQYGYCDYQ